ncbi:MAG TPA: MauE/DoxX family redox-associated membrane protein [Pseudomonadales bacterium]|nr:MauE/DoxX family redox-associated membrane protein [Pseudomonadales bacterium]
MTAGLIDPVLQTVVACALSALFAAAAAHKGRSGLHFQAQLSEYRMLPEALVPAAARLLMLLEMLIAVALLLPASRQVAGAGAAILLAVYGLAIAINLLRGRTWIDCGCGDRPQMLSPWLLVRSALLVTGALLVALPAFSRPVGSLDVVLGVLGFVALLVLYMAVEVLLANASTLREWNEARD